MSSIHRRMSIKIQTLFFPGRAALFTAVRLHFAHFAIDKPIKRWDNREK